MRSAYPKVFSKEVLAFDSEKNAYTLQPLFKENKDSPGKKFEVSEAAVLLNGYSLDKDFQFRELRMAKPVNMISVSDFILILAFFFFFPC